MNQQTFKLSRKFINNSLSGAYSGIVGSNPPFFLRKFFQFARVFQKKAKTPPKFLKPLPQKISVYALAAYLSESSEGHPGIFRA